MPASECPVAPRVATTCRQPSWAFCDGLAEVRRQQQVLQLRIGVERFFDAIQEHRANDAAAAPQQGTVAVVERPLVLLGRGLQLHEALGVAANLRGVQRVAHLLDELRRGRPCTSTVRPVRDFARSHAGVLQRRQAAGIDRFGHQRAGHAQVERQLAHPLAGSLGAGRVEDHVDQIPSPVVGSLTLKMSRVISIR